MKKTLLTVIILFGALSASQSFASVNGHQHNQKDRIKIGVKSGELTYHETKNLVHDQKHINKVEQKMRADSNGTLDRQERARLNAMQAKASHEIYKKKHNDRSR